MLPTTGASCTRSPPGRRNSCRWCSDHLGRRAIRRVASVDELPPHRAVLLDLAPKGMLEMAGSRFPQRYRNDLAAFRYGPGAFKLDWTLDAPIPWKSAECLRAATVHLGGTMDEIAESELQVAHGGH